MALTVLQNQVSNVVILGLQVKIYLHSIISLPRAEFSRQQMLEGLRY